MSDRPLVCVSVYGHLDTAVECLRALAANTAADIEILVIDDFSPTPLWDVLPPDIAEDPRFRFQRNATNLGYVGTSNLALTWSPDSDVVLVNSDVVVSVGWLERLERAANASSHVATVSVLANEGSILSVRLDSTVSPIHSATELATINSRLADLPEIPPVAIPVAIGHCLYIRRAALHAVGLFDDIFAPGYGEEVDFSLRCSAAGFTHVVAPDVYVLHTGGVSFGGRLNALQTRAARVLLRRYPDYDRLIHLFLESPDPLETLFVRVRLVQRGALRLLIDGRIFAVQLGTPNIAPGFVRALGEEERLRITIRSDRERDNLPDELSAMQIVPARELRDLVSRNGRFDCVISRFGISDASTIGELWEWAHRVVLLNANSNSDVSSNANDMIAHVLKHHDADLVAAVAADAVFANTERGPFSATAKRLAESIWELTSRPPRLASSLRARLLAPARTRAHFLFKIRRSAIGRLALPPGSARTRVARRLLGRVLGAGR